MYNAIFQKRFPRVFPEMKKILQISQEKRIGDQFLFEQGTLIRLYGFVHQPYLFPAFLNPRFFSMELVRQRLIVENEHFLNFKKSIEIKYPWVVGPFVIKNKVSLPMIERLLKEMVFFTKPNVNYDPHHVISNSRKAMKINPFEHEEIVGLREASNWYDYPKESPKDTDMQGDSNSFVREITSLQPDTSKLISAYEKITPLASHLERTNK